MPFEPAARKPVSEVVFEDVRTAILSGRFAPGDPLPSERQLSESFAVNRHAVREALKRLQQAGLVQVNHGGATRVLDWRRTGGLDLLPHLAYALHDGPGTAASLRAILEMRRSIGIDVARLAARRATAPVLAELRAFADEQPAATDLEALGTRYENVWRALVTASDNLAYALSYNTLLVGTGAVAELSHAVFAAEARDLDAHRALIAAVADGDETLAAERADELLSRSLATAFGAETPAATAEPKERTRA
jgi:DNA-binding FadR family transcriptional regulator